MLAAIALLAAALLAGLDRLTRDRIEAQRRAHSLQTVSAMLEPGGHDNDLLADTTTLPLAGQPQPATVYRARLGGVAQAAVIELNTSTGYSGSIGLLVAVDHAFFLEQALVFERFGFSVEMGEQRMGHGRSLGGRMDGCTLYAGACSAV